MTALQKLNIMERLKREPKQRTLEMLLLGKYIPTDSGDFYIMVDSERKRNGLWEKHVRYPSRPYTVCKTDRKGEIEETYEQSGIYGIILEPEKPNHKGIIALHQHNMEFDKGKSEVMGIRKGRFRRTQEYGLDLAKKGYTVLGFDFVPFEERSLHDERILSYQEERFIKQELTLDDLEPMGIHVLDVMRGIDLLKKQGIDDIGLIGHSLGGMVIPYSMALDERIKAGASNCGVGTFDSVWRNRIVHNWAYSVHGMKKEFGEFHKLFELIAERPVLISAAKGDADFPIEGARKCHEWASNFYKDKQLLKLYEFDGVHAFPQKARENAYRFLDEHL